MLVFLLPYNLAFRESPYCTVCFSLKIGETTYQPIITGKCFSFFFFNYIYIYAHTLQYKCCTYVLHGYLGNDDDDNAETPHTVLAEQLLDFHMKTSTHTQTNTFINCMV